MHLLTKSEIVYLVVVGVLGPLVVWIVRRVTEQAKVRRTVELKHQRKFDAVETETPLHDPVKRARRNAIESVINRFSIIRRVFYILAFIIWGIAISVPFLGEVSGQVVSMLTTAGAVLLGIAARPLFENAISGIVISFSRQINTGDTVLIDGHYGTVEDITLTHTIVKVWDWRRYLMPNSNLYWPRFQPSIFLA